MDEEVDVESGLHELPEYPTHQADGTLRYHSAFLHQEICTSSLLSTLHTSKGVVCLTCCELDKKRCSVSGTGAQPKIGWTPTT